MLAVGLFVVITAVGVVIWILGYVNENEKTERIGKRTCFAGLIAVLISFALFVWPVPSLIGGRQLETRSGSVADTQAQAQALADAVKAAEQAATNAQNSATTAEQAATNAQSNVTVAEQAATNAQNSVTAAEQAATSAQSSVTVAEQAATNAQNSATAAEQAATNAQNSATTAEQAATNAQNSATTAEQANCCNSSSEPGQSVQVAQDSATGASEWPKLIAEDEVYTADADGQILVCDSDALLKGKTVWVQNWMWNGNPDLRGELFVMDDGDKGRCTFTSGTIYPTGTSLDELAEAEIVSGNTTVAIHQSTDGELVHSDWAK